MNDELKIGGIRVSANPAVPPDTLLVVQPGERFTLYRDELEATIEVRPPKLLAAMRLIVRPAPRSAPGGTTDV
jgi:hypothetical protein